MKTCLHRKEGMCQIRIYPVQCERDYSNHINNKSCPNYYEINIFEFEVDGENKGLIRKLQNAMD